VKTVLSIAGSDSSGGAGIQADLKTMIMNGVYGMSAVTALTAQNTTGVRGILESSPEFLGQQIDAVFEDIRPDAVKIGMVPSKALVQMTADRLRFHRAERIVLDPVMVATSGSALMVEGAGKALVEELFPLGTVLTPNIPEAEALSQTKIRNGQDMEEAARIISSFTGGAVLVKGGHLSESADDLLYEQGKSIWLPGERVDNSNTHGTGCTLSSAIACGLAGGKSLEDSVKGAKAYITGALKAGLDLGKGSGPLNHMYAL